MNGGYFGNAAQCKLLADRGDAESQCFFGLLLKNVEGFFRILLKQQDISNLQQIKDMFKAKSIMECVLGRVKVFPRI
jgi:hypothetical protein